QPFYTNSQNLPGNNQNNQSNQKGVKEAPKEHIPISPVKALKEEHEVEPSYVQYIYEDEEDVCPTCLEEFCFMKIPNYLSALMSI
ncbi:hypothetical protein Leryth_015746, partial [Lithospermum erythrorhizon]